MDNDSFNFGEAKRIPIVDYLASLGFEPARVRGNNYWYRSPYREEQTASFKVNIKENLWYDFGVGKGGTILDLGVEIHGCTIREFISKLESANFNARPVQKVPANEQESKLYIVSTYEIKEPQLIEYLKSRSIDPDFARQHCVEAEFLIRTRRYKAIAFPNNSGGFELRNPWFKGSSSPKDISLISSGTNSSKLSLFEGFIDFLSALTIINAKFTEATNDSGFLVLNSLAFVPRVIPLLRSFSDIKLFLDNDNAGRDAKDKLQSQGIRFQDASTWYSKHKDVNEYLLSSEWFKQREALHPRPRSRLRR